MDKDLVEELTEEASRRQTSGGKQTSYQITSRICETRSSQSVHQEIKTDGVKGRI